MDEVDKVFYTMLWNDGYDEGIGDAERGEGSKLDNVEYIDGNFPTPLNTAWDKGYRAGYDEGYNERNKEDKVK